MRIISKRKEKKILEVLSNCLSILDNTSEIDEETYIKLISNFFDISNLTSGICGFIKLERLKKD